MKYISIYDLPSSITETDEFINCNDYGALDHDDELNDYDLAFEKFAKCRLKLIDQDWVCEFNEDDYTWFVLTWF